MEMDERDAEVRQKVARPHGQDIGWAVTQMKAGLRVSREGWNGKGMWVAHMSAEDWHTTMNPTPESMTGPPLSPFIVMFTADGKLVPWLCSQTDLLATDWDQAPGT